MLTTWYGGEMWEEAERMLKNAVVAMSIVAILLMMPGRMPADVAC